MLQHSLFLFCFLLVHITSSEAQEGRDNIKIMAKAKLMRPQKRFRYEGSSKASIQTPGYISHSENALTSDASNQANVQLGEVKSAPVQTQTYKPVISNKQDGKPVNILLILADDLGYGDTSVPPFTGTGVQTPHLQKMAARGTIMTNFHSAAATCTPTRASLLTGLYPWRLGIKAVFEYGERGKSNRDDWLVKVPTAPMLFANHNYTTFHSGKWHLGGMRNDDLDMRKLPYKGEGVAGGQRCPHPGPQQQGFNNYVSVLDGPGAPRQNYLQVQNRLYSEGCNYLLEDDETLPTNKYNISGYLSYCEAKHAMRAMTDSVKEQKPFYIHLWFHAPHGPWQEIPGYTHMYPEMQKPSNPEAAPLCGTQLAKRGRFCHQLGQNGKKVLYEKGWNRMLHYKTMVSDMDRQIGMVLDHIDSLGIASNTLVLFTSDNGPEDDAGKTSIFRGRKRSLYEGGIRVPAIAQWTGTITEGGVSSHIAVSTDVLATFLDAANIPIPSHVMIDGQSFLSDLTNAVKVPIEENFHKSDLANSALVPVNDNNSIDMLAMQKKNKLRRKAKRKQDIQERLILWHNDFEGPRNTAAIFYGYKLLLNEFDVPFELFDLVRDPAEQNNLLPGGAEAVNGYWKKFSEGFPHFSEVLKDTKIVTLDREILLKNRDDKSILLSIVHKIYGLLAAYAKRGNEAHRRYRSTHQGHEYQSTPPSDTRHAITDIYKKKSRRDMEILVRETLTTGSCRATPCNCSIPKLYKVETLPFVSVAANADAFVKAAIIPSPFVNSSIFLSSANNHQNLWTSKLF